MADLEAVMREGFEALVDELPRLRPDLERGAWALGYLYALAAGPCPTSIRTFGDGVLGMVFEVDEPGPGGMKVGYVMMGMGRFMVPVRVYER